MEIRPSAFISYSHDSPEHAERVLQLAERLREDGIDCRLDQYVNGTPSKGWPRWMLDELDAAQSVLLVCTETYYRRFRGQEAAGKGHGADWEGAIITNEIYTARSDTTKFLPLTLSDQDSASIPEPVRGHTRYCLDSEAVYQALLDALLGQAGVEPRPLGQPRRRGRRRAEPLRFEMGSEPLIPAGLEQLRIYGQGFAGRQAELAHLDRAWVGRQMRVLVLHAAGGTGKTRLLARWLDTLAERDYAGAGAVFIHSFYSQGSDERRNASSEVFFERALAHFGHDGPPILDAEQKARRLVELLLARRGLLVLDGLEPLQHPLAFDQGRLKDPAIEHLLLDLAGAVGTGPGLCLVVSRQPVVELEHHLGPRVDQRLLERLDRVAGRALLRQLGVAGADAELEAAVDELRGHAYSLMLLGRYLAEATDDADIRRRREISLLDQDAADGDHARHLFVAYLAHLGPEGPEAALLNLLGFFDRPAELGLLEALWGPEEADVGPAEPGAAALARLATPLAGLAPGERRRLLGRLDRLGLIAWQLGAEAIDAHPLLREAFAERLQGQHPEAWRAGHRRLYRRLCAQAEHRPDTLEGLQPLYQAVAHGCRAGLEQEALDQVYIERILRGTGHDGFYSRKQLGAEGTNLGAVACFFQDLADRPWARPSPRLPAPDLGWLLNEAGLCLLALGRLGEARGPMGAGLALAVEQENRHSAAIGAGNLGALELALGGLAAARDAAERAVAFADRDGDQFLRIIGRALLADALHQSGQAARARDVFAAAEAIQAERQPQYPRLYSRPGSRYCDLLLAGVERAAWGRWLGTGAADPAGFPAACGAVAERAEEALDIAENNRWLQDIALDQLTLARAALYPALLGPVAGPPDPAAAEAPLQAAVAGLRQAGDTQYLPLGLLTRAWQRRLAGDGPGARADLDQAWAIAERGPMPLHQADILLTRARLFGLPDPGVGWNKRSGSTDQPRAPIADPYPWTSPQTDLAEARRLIEACGYHRRDAELADAEAAIR